MIIPYKGINRIFTSLYGIITSSLSAYFSRARFNDNDHDDPVKWRGQFHWILEWNKFKIRLDGIREKYVCNIKAEDFM